MKAGASTHTGDAADEESVDALFDRMKELVDLLPSMEEKGRRLLADAAARRACEAMRYRKGQERELAYVRGLFEEHSKALEAAIAAGDAEAEERERYATLRFGNQIGIKNGAVASARQAEEDRLAEGGFDGIEAAGSRILPDEERDALVRETDAFQEDYRTTLEACRVALDEEESGRTE